MHWELCGGSQCLEAEPWNSCPVAATKNSRVKAQEPLPCNAHLQRMGLWPKWEDAQYACAFDLLEVRMGSSQVLQNGPGLALCPEHVLESFLASTLEEVCVSQLQQGGASEGCWPGKLSVAVQAFCVKVAAKSEQSVPDGTCTEAQTD